MGNVCGGEKATKTVVNGKQPGAKAGEKPCIFFNRASPPASATMVIAQMVGAGMFDAKEVDLMSGEHKKPEYLKINSSGTVPAFKHGDFVIGESRAIQLMAVRAHGFSDKMEGKTPQERAKSSQALFWESSSFSPNVMKIARPIVLEKAAPNEEHIKEFFDGPVNQLNSMLADCKFMAGDHLSVADISAAFHLAGLSQLLGEKVGQMLVAHENVCKWLTCSLKGCEKLYEAVCHMEKTYPGGASGCLLKLMCAKDKIRLTYWPGRGRAHMSRMLLHFKGVEFEDCFMEQSKWPDCKAKLADRLIYPNLPYLEDGDKIISESYAILKYLGRKYDLAPKTEQQRVMCDQIFEFLSDCFSKIVKIAFCPDAEEKKTMYKALCDGAVELWTPINEKLGKCKWTLGDDCTCIDFAMATVVSMWCDWVPELAEKCSNLCKIEKQLRAESECLDQYLKECKFENMKPPTL